MEFQDAGGVAELAALAIATFGLDLAEQDKSFLVLAGEASGVEAEANKGLVAVDDVEIDAGLFVGWVGGAVEELGFEGGDAVETPGGRGEFGDELGFRCRGGLEFVVEL